MSENKGLGVSGSSVEGNISHLIAEIHLNSGSVLVVEVQQGVSFFHFCEKIARSGYFINNAWYPVSSISKVVMLD